ncbi:TetR/AcrR family transcriptional regulator C-terminal domain-containing protein [Streptomyces sp. NPDC049954]|uniref:TetR/AcrR family transcriptional regulator n=1 Tax=Streptomyces sp. NPDC049954 TaxID=3155779 RepID=UPI00344424B6
MPSSEPTPSPTPHEPGEAPARTGRPPRLSLERIVAAAHHLLARDDASKLTMRRLAKEVGSTPMALYHHVRDRDDLLLRLLDDVAASMPRPVLPTEPGERVVTLFTALRDHLAAHAWTVEVLATDALMARRALWFVEAVLDSAAACGLPPEEAVRLYRQLWYFTVGELQVRATAARRRADQAPSHRDQVFAELAEDCATHPRLAAVAPRWQELTAQDTYEDGLRDLLAGRLGRRVAGG